MHRTAGDVDTPVVIAGAGPVGTVAALLFARLGVASTVLERHPGGSGQPWALHLDDESVRVLAGLGLGPGFAAISRPAVGLRLLDRRRRPVLAFERGAGVHGCPQDNLFDPPELDGLLRARLGPPARLRGGREIVALEQAGDGPVQVAVRDVDSGSVRTLRTHAVLATDAHDGGVVREAIGSRMRRLGRPERLFVVSARCTPPLEHWGGTDQICDPDRPVSYVQLTPDRYHWAFGMGPDETAGALVARLPELLAPWVGGHRVDDVRTAEHVVQATLADRWRSGRVFLLGEAAHVTPPFIGQGLGGGLRDARNLVWKLAAVLDGSAPESTLDSYQSERAPHAERLIRTAIRVRRAMTGGPLTLAGLRSPLSRLLISTTDLDARAERTLTTRYPTGPWVRRRHRRDPAGTLCPQLVVRADGTERVLDEVLGAGFALIVDGPADPAGLAEAARTLDAKVLPLVAGSALDSPALREWLHRGRASAALLRPDRVVLATEAGPRRPPR